MKGNRDMWKKIILLVYILALCCLYQTFATDTSGMFELENRFDCYKDHENKIIPDSTYTKKSVTNLLIEKNIIWPKPVNKPANDEIGNIIEQLIKNKHNTEKNQGMNPQKEAINQKLNLEIVEKTNQSQSQSQTQTAQNNNSIESQSLTTTAQNDNSIESQSLTATAQRDNSIESISPDITKETAQKYNSTADKYPQKKLSSEEIDQLIENLILINSEKKTKNKIIKQKITSQELVQYKIKPLTEDEALSIIKIQTPDKEDP